MTHDVYSISPELGPNDAPVSVTILGVAFSTQDVYFGDNLAENIVVVNSNTITCDVPADLLPGTYDVIVSDGDDLAMIEDGFRVHYPLPAMPFSDQTMQSIIDRVLSGLSVGGFDTSQGSWSYQIVAAMALEMQRNYILMDDIVQNTFPQYARLGFLDLIAEGLGLVRLPATTAIGEIAVTGTNGTVIPIGTQFSTVVAYGQSATPAVFESTEAGTISGGTVTVAIQATVAGTNGNAGIGQITRLISSISGVTAVNNAAATTGGTARETDDDFRIRLLNFVQNPAGGGNKQDYINWALEVPGIGSASCVPLGSGAGTVDVYILTDELAVPGAPLIAEVQAYIAPGTPGSGEGKAPIGADVTVAAPSLVTVGVTVNVLARDGFDTGDVETDVEAAISAYISGLPIGDDVIYAGVANAIYNTPGVLNYSSLLVDAGTATITIDDDEKAMPGTIAATVS